MAKTFMTRYGLVTIPTRNPRKKRGRSKKKQRRKARAKARKTNCRNPRKKSRTCTKKVGRWRCSVKARTLTCAGAKHAYKTNAAACAAYKRITSVAKVESFVRRYGSKKTCRAVCGKKSPHAKGKRRNCGSRNAPITASQAAAMKAVLRAHGNPKRRKKTKKKKATKKKATRKRNCGRRPKRRKARNVPLTPAERRALRSTLKRHGYL